MKRRMLLIFPAALILAGLLLWHSGVFQVVDRVDAPNGALRATVSEKTVEGVPAVVVALRGTHSGTVSYLHTAYEGLWWSPDSSKYLVEMRPLTADGIALELSDLERNAGTYLASAVAVTMERVWPLPLSPWLRAEEVGFLGRRRRSYGWNGRRA